MPATASLAVHGSAARRCAASSLVPPPNAAATVRVRAAGPADPATFGCAEVCPVRAQRRRQNRGPGGPCGQQIRERRRAGGATTATSGQTCGDSRPSPSRPGAEASQGVAWGTSEEESVRRWVAWARGEAGVWSVVIPTFNRLPILLHCLRALEAQLGWQEAGIERYEVVVVDDGSHDGTVPTLLAMGVGASDCDCNEGEDSAGAGGVSEGAVAFPHVRLLQQDHGGATAARNLGVAAAAGGTIVFIDSDMVVCPGFLAAHAHALAEASSRFGDDRTFSYGRVVNTSNFDNPMSEPFKLTDYSAAFFATGNVAISRRMLAAATLRLAPPSSSSSSSSSASSPQPSSARGAESWGAGEEGPAAHAGGETGVEGEWDGGGRAMAEEGAAEQRGAVGGPFDAEFSKYGWEDLELGERLRQCGARICQCPEAVGFHWHPPFHPSQLPALIRQERQRGENGVRFFLKHRTLNVRLMVQMTPFHSALWTLLTLGGTLNERSLAPLLTWLVQQGHPGLALGLLSPVLNWHTVQATREEVQRLRDVGVDV